MVNVISKNQIFNISESLYESILKNNPELLNEDDNSSNNQRNPANNIFSIQTQEENSSNMVKLEPETRNLIKKAYKSKNLSKEEKQIIIKKAIEKDKELKQKKAVDLYNQFNDKINKEKNKKGGNKKKENNPAPSQEEIRNPTQEDAKQIYDILENYLFNSDIPDNILNFYGSVQQEFNKKMLPFGSFIIAKFYLFGKKSIQWLKETPKKITVDYIKNTAGPFLEGDLWRLVKQMPMNEFWKNTAVIHCRTENSFSLVTSLINNIQNDRDEIDCFGKQIPTGFNTRTMIFTIRDKKPYETNELGDIRKRQTNGEMKSIMSKGNNEKVKQSYNNKKPIDKLYVKGKDDKYDDKFIFNNDEKLTLSLLKNIKRPYYIIVTEGMFKTGKFLSNIGKKLSKISPSTGEIGNINLGSQ